jgi:hypothetical protein
MELETGFEPAWTFVGTLQKYCFRPLSHSSIKLGRDNQNRTDILCSSDKSSTIELYPYIETNYTPRLQPYLPWRSVYKTWFLHLRIHLQPLENTFFKAYFPTLSSH